MVSNAVMFVVAMYMNNCPKHISTRASRFDGGDADKYVARSLGRISFQPLLENHLFGLLLPLCCRFSRNRGVNGFKQIFERNILLEMVKIVKKKVVYIIPLFADNVECWN
ncbi:hypothetical protein CASFOL_003820 [Castilleja foliolosa]|uniref:Uncharacterized protein n=1 Tax=Castilleja foliolosa TaxID=1961234 RepID=A0ABD3EM51_9LAMI